MFFVVSGQVIFLYRAVSVALCVQQCHCDMLYVLEAGIDTDRPGVKAGYLEAVILGRVVRGGNLNTAAGAEMIDCKIHLRRINHPYINHICAGGVHSFYKGIG